MGNHAHRGISRHSIVGKGNHSVNHIQKLKPKVEQLCRELGLQYTSEENSGRIYVNLTGGPAHMPPQQHGQPHGGGQQHHGGTQPGQQPNPNQGQNDMVEEVITKFLPKLLKKLDGCCIVM